MQEACQKLSGGLIEVGQEKKIDVFIVYITWLKTV